MKKMYILLILIVFSVTFWLYAYYSANDFSVPTRTIEKFDRVLAVFPHPDDEALSTSGLVTKLRKQNSNVRYLILTRGEKGTSDAHLDNNLKDIRKLEAEKVSKILSLDELVHEDIPDGEVTDSRERVLELVKNHIEEFDPELIVTFDLAGLYGHPDHIATSEVVTDIIKKDYKDIALWYVSYPQKILDQTSLPEHMAEDKGFKKRRVYPTHKINVGLGGINNKTKVIYAYKSQREAFRKGLPISQLPLWFYTSLMKYEYFHEAN